jgi:uncharacterized protein YndB with AHSA1/START domain
VTDLQLDLAFEMVYPHPRETVWQALTDSRALAAWLFDNDFEPRVGKTFTLKTRHLGVLTCTVRTLHPPRLMEWVWSDPDSAVCTVVAFRLEEVEGGTRLTVRHTGPAKPEQRDDITVGWPAKLDSLGRWFASIASKLPAGSTVTVIKWNS